MKNGKKFGLTIFQVVLSIILIAVIVFSVGVNYIFGSSVRSGSIFGKHIYVMHDDSMNTEGGIPNGAAVIAESDEIAVLTDGNVILFSEEAGIETIMRIVEVVHNENNTVYKVAADKEQDKVLNVPKENVIAKCTMHNTKLGAVITFLKSMVGILAGMILPCLILLVMLMLKILSVRRREREEDNIVYPETNGIVSNSEMRDPQANPLFDPTMAPKPDASFAMKKSSIAENFAMKPAAKKNVNNSPAARNMQTENAVEKFRAAVDEKPAAPVSRKASLAPEAATSERSEKMAAIKAALNNQEQTVNEPEQEFVEFRPEQTESYTFSDAQSERMSYTQPLKQEYTAPQPEPVAEPVYQQPVQQPEPVPQPVPQPAPYTPPQPAARPKPAPRKQDNIKSIDDLIRALEEEKKKL
ncbi:MAG: hypothetical protein IJA12_06380 [Oscillospiraceae bacterium]|nr:hypothetical protein [Oscillospiraceae bacterium]